MSDEVQGPGILRELEPLEAGVGTVQDEAAARTVSAGDSRGLRGGMLQRGHSKILPGVSRRDHQHPPVRGSAAGAEERRGREILERDLSPQEADRFPVDDRLRDESLERKPVKLAVGDDDETPDRGEALRQRAKELLEQIVPNRSQTPEIGFGIQTGIDARQRPRQHLPVGLHLWIEVGAWRQPVEYRLLPFNGEQH